MSKLVKKWLGWASGANKDTKRIWDLTSNPAKREAYVNLTSKDAVRSALDGDVTDEELTCILEDNLPLEVCPYCSEETSDYQEHKQNCFRRFDYFSVARKHTSQPSSPLVQRMVKKSIQTEFESKVGVRIPLCSPRLEALNRLDRANSLPTDNDVLNTSLGGATGSAVDETCPYCGDHVFDYQEHKLNCFRRFEFFSRRAQLTTCPYCGEDIAEYQEHRVTCDKRRTYFATREALVRDSTIRITPGGLLAGVRANFMELAERQGGSPPEKCCDPAGTDAEGSASSQAATPNDATERLLLYLNELDLPPSPAAPSTPIALAASALAREEVMSPGMESYSTPDFYFNDTPANSGSASDARACQALQRVDCSVLESLNAEKRSELADLLATCLASHRGASSQETVDGSSKKPFVPDAMSARDLVAASAREAAWDTAEEAKIISTLASCGLATVASLRSLSAAQWRGLDLPEGAEASLKGALGAPSFPFPIIAFEDLVMLDLVGEGSFGQVEMGYYGEHAVAIKRLNVATRDEAAFGTFLAEAIVLSQLDHENTVKMHGAVVDPPNLCIVMELVEGGDLSTLIYNGKDYDAASILLGIGRGMAYLHSHRILHRDLKPKNVLMTPEGVVKISDYGLAKVQMDTFVQTQCGTPTYLAPEVLDARPYSQPADVYSYGVVSWEVYARKIPFAAKEYTNVFEMALDIIDNHVLPYATMPAHVPEHIATVIDMSLDHNPAARPSFSTICQALEDFT